MALDIVTVDEGAPAGALTPKGAAMCALLRFEELLRDLEPADRAWFASELAELAEEARAND